MLFPCVNTKWPSNTPSSGQTAISSRIHHPHLSTLSPSCSTISYLHHFPNSSISKRLLRLYPCPSLLSCPARQLSTIRPAFLLFTWNLFDYYSTHKPDMAPTTVHLVRHAQGYHNISVANHAIHDPLLTPVGEEQCRVLQQDFPQLKDVDCVIASPLKRTIYTALLSFEPIIESKKLKVIALPELQETSDLPCDTGSSVEEIEREFKGKPIDTSLLHLEANKSWNDKKGRWAPTAAAIDARASDAREYLYSRKEKNIVVVTHGGFLHYFTQDWSDTHRLNGTPSAGKFLNDCKMLLVILGKVVWAILVLMTAATSVICMLTHVMQARAGPTPNSATTSSTLPAERLLWSKHLRAGRSVLAIRSHSPRRSRRICSAPPSSSGLSRRKKSRSTDVPPISSQRYNLASSL